MPKIVYDDIPDRGEFISKLNGATVAPYTMRLCNSIRDLFRYQFEIKVGQEVVARTFHQGLAIYNRSFEEKAVELAKLYEKECPQEGEITIYCCYPKDPNISDV